MEDEIKQKFIKNGLLEKTPFEKIIENPNFNIEDKLFANRIALNVC